jgi:hypothetical protein
MALQQDKTDLQGHFLAWLGQPEAGTFCRKAGGYFYTVIKVRKNEDFDYIYYQRQYNGDGIERGDDFGYGGILRKRDGRLYDGHFELQALLGDMDCPDEPEMLEEMKQAVRATVDNTLGGDRSKLAISEISSKYMQEQLDYSRQHKASSEARKIYLSSADYANHQYRYNHDNWGEAAILAYILDPAAYVATQAAEYIANNQECLLYNFLESDAISAEYAKLLDNPLDPVHRIKQIMQAVNASSAKTITVTICKNDIDFTFKAEADHVRRDTYGIYNDWCIVAADRRRFQGLFGRNASFKPEDILRIEYARTIIYQAEEVEADTP